LKEDGKECLWFNIVSWEYHSLEFRVKVKVKVNVKVKVQVKAKDVFEGGW
jgi:hypothetical protein